jgi:hypothetical protein
LVVLGQSGVKDTVKGVTTLAVSPVGPSDEELESSLRAQPNPPQAPASPKSSRAERLANTMVMAILFAGPALLAVHIASASDPDVFWHLQTGQWIFEHHAVPTVDPFSWTLAGKPWQAYSWLFEAIVFKLFLSLGLVGLVTYTSAMVVAITAALFSMIKRLQGDFSVAVALTLAAVTSLTHLYMPRPWLLTILFFTLELNILMQARRTGRSRELLWLPLIFALWANTHIEFVDGLLILGVAFAETIVARSWTAAETRVPPAWMGVALLASVLATLANPYGWRVYSVVFDYSSRLATGGSALSMVSEVQSIPFRSLPDFLILLFALASAAALAWHRRFLLFESCLLLFAVFESFHSQRDLWLTAVVGAAILASRIVSSHKTSVRISKSAAALAVVVAGLVIVAGFRMMRVNDSLLQTQIATTLPADAVKAIQARGYTGPLYDDYNWGGYLMWALRMPVSIDGRASFYGDERITRSLKTWSAQPDWASDPDLKSAGIVIGPDQSALTQLLRTDPHFQLAYEDKIAAVFIARK